MVSAIRRQGVAVWTAHRESWWVALGLALLVGLFLGDALTPPSGQILGGHDVRGQFFPWLTWAAESLRAGRLPLWDPYTLGGYPFFSNPQVGFFYPPAWLAFLLPVRIGLSLYVAWHLWWAGLGMWLFVRRVSGSRTGALLAALTFTFSGFAAARLMAGHIGMVATASWLPWILVALLWSIERADVPSGLLAGLPLGGAILAGNTTLLFYIGLIWLAFAAYLFLSPRERPALRPGQDGETADRPPSPQPSPKGEGGRVLVARQFLLMGLVGVALGAIQLLPLAEATLLSSRQGGTLAEFGSRWSLPPVHLITLFLPTYFGVPGAIGYWSVDNFEELTYYVGALPLLALLLALRASFGCKPSRLAWLYLALIAFGVLAALGAYGWLYPLLYRLIVVFRLGRAPARAAFLLVFAASALLGEVIAHWERLPVERARPMLRSVMPWLLVTLFLAGVLGLAATGAAFVVLHPSETGGRLWHQAGGWAWALLAFVGGGYILWRYLAIPERRGLLTLALAGWVVMDLWFFGARLITLQPAATAPFWTDARQIMGPSQTRAVPWAVTHTIQNDAALTGVRSALGYVPVELAAYHDLIADLADPRSAALDVLGVEYVLSTGELEGKFLSGERPLSPVASTGAVQVYRRARVLPLARLVYQAEVIADPAQARARLHQPDFDPATTVILSQAPVGALGPAPATPSRATLLAWQPEQWLIETESATAGLLVVAENAYPGWRVRVDGQRAEPLTAYTALRAVQVPAGTHTVEWLFDPLSLKVGAACTGAALLLVALAGWWQARAKRRRAQQERGALHRFDVGKQEIANPCVTRRTYGTLDLAQCAL